MWSDNSNERWQRPLRAWESDKEEELNLFVSNIHLSLRKDLVKWNLNGNSFSTRDCYQLIEGFDNHNEGN